MAAKNTKDTKKKEKTAKANNVLRYIAIILVIVFTSFSLITLTLRERLLSPNLYTTALDSSGIYDLATEVLEDTATDALLALEREIIIGLGVFQEPEEQTVFESTLIWVISSVLEDATENFVSNLSAKIDLRGILKSTVEDIIVADTAWLAGEAPDPEIFQIIPEPEEIEKIQGAQLTDVVRGFTRELFGLNQLPQCTNQNAVELSIARIADGTITKVTCTNEEIDILLNAAIDEFVPGDVLSEVEESAQAELDRLGISPIIDGLLSFSLLISNFKQLALDMRTLFASMQETATFMLLVSIPLLIYAMIVTKVQRLRTFLKIYFGTGLVITAYAVLQYLILSNAVTTFLGGGLIISTEGLLTATQQVAFAQSLRSIQLAIVRDLSISVFIIGMIVTIIFGTPFTILKIMDRTVKPKPSNNK